MGTPAPPLAILSLVAAQDKSKLASPDPWIVLLDMNWQGNHVRLARNTDSVQFDAGDGLGVQTYQAFNFEVGVIEKQATGQLPSVQLRVSNVNRMVQGILEQYLGAVGATVSLYAVNMAHGAGEADLALQFTVLQSVADAKFVTFTLGAISPLRQLFPRFLYRADFCMWVINYKGPQCGYTGPIPSCDGTLNGSNGCTVHNNSVRFGAFPGIGTNGGLIASQI
jgi:lambda family phage minor tail protein L